MNTSKNVGELSSLTFLLQVIKDNYEPEHSQNINGYETNYKQVNKLLKVAKKDIIISQRNHYVDLEIKLTFKQVFLK